MPRRKASRGFSSAENSCENTPQQSDSDNESATLRSKSRKKVRSEAKTSAELCAELGVRDVELDWAEADYQNLTTYSIFVRMVRPQLFAINTRVHPSKLTQILEAKWQEFQDSNPFTKKAAVDDMPDDNGSDNPSTDCDDDGSSQRGSTRDDRVTDDSSSKGKSTKALSVSGGLKIKLSLKPLRKSSRERKAPQKSVMSDKEFEKLLDEESASDSNDGDRRRKKRKKRNESDEESDYGFEKSSAKKKIEKKKRKVTQESDDDLNNGDSSRQTSEDEDYGGSSGSDSQRKQNKKQRVVIPGERKSSRSRKGVSSMAEMTDKEFEKLLREQENEKKENEKRERKKEKALQNAREAKSRSASKADRADRRSKRPEKDESDDEDKSENASKDNDSKKGGESGNESDHIWYCQICKDGGNLLLCDTCPKSFHKECLKLDIIPDGEWSCPVCTGEGLPEKGDTSDEDAHDTFCRVCKDGGDVVLCDFCPLVYHMNCILPPMKNLPDGEWKCPVCVMKAEPMKAKVKQVLTWRWTRQPNVTDELDHTHSPEKQKAISKVNEDESSDVKAKNFRQSLKGYDRELFVRYEFHSYWDCDWIPELKLEINQQILHTYFRRKFDMNEPPALEDGSSFGRPRHKTGVSEDDPHNLEERFYRYGIKPEWLQVHRIVNYQGNGKDRRYLVKWRDLGYSECTWEFPEDVAEGLEDWEKHVNAFWARRKQKMNEEKVSKRFEMPKKVLLRKKLEEQPSYLDTNGGKLHPYQLEGLNWLRFSWSQGTNTILADEMGLGKTIQAISIVYCLWKEGYTNKPFIICAPLSTVPNWEREFEFWAPDMYVVTYVGVKENRQVIREHEFSYKEGAFAYTHKACKFRDNHRPKFDVLLTSYEMVSVDFATFSSIEWEVLVIDEAHRLKNNQSLFFRTLSDYRIKYKLLLTGTPLQNNLEELFNLLNFLEPGKFSRMEEFLNEFSEISKDEQVMKLHDMLAPHMLRRMKSDVLKDIPSKSEFIVRVELSAMQKKYYRHILTKNFEALNCKGHSNQTSLLNIMMDLRKCCNHPYLFPGAEKDAPLTSRGLYEGNAMTKACGKLDLLAKMLKKLKRDGHRVLIFSQMTRVLDILEDFLTFHQYGYERIDGNIAGNKRQESIDRFNNPESKQFVFLLSTRAGGLGINLATADTVVIYDMDWNPHNDIQAFSRAHRIGQRNKVMIYRFVSRNTVEEKIAQVCKQKMMLSELIVHRGMNMNTNPSVNEKKESLTKHEINDILKYGAENLFKDDEEGQVVYDDVAVEKLLDRSQEVEGEREKDFGMNEYLRSFKVASYQVKEGVDEDEEEKPEDEEKEEEPAPEDDGRRANETDVQYWQRVLGPAYHEHVIQTLREQEEVAKTLGKGKRIRKQINYAEQEMMAAAIESSKKKKVQEEEAIVHSDYEPSDSSGSSDEESGEENEPDAADKAKRKGKLHQQLPSKQPQVALPPLVERNDGQVLILGFTARQRRAFLDAVMRYGMPPEDPYRSQWLVRDLRSKPERIFKAYVSLFMRHLCEPIADGTDKFADGVPREGLSRQHVLTRIGIIALIRKKVHEFEDINGVDSIAEFPTLVERSKAASELNSKSDNKPDSSDKPDNTNEEQAADSSQIAESESPKDNKQTNVENETSDTVTTAPSEEGDDKQTGKDVVENSDLVKPKSPAADNTAADNAPSDNSVKPEAADGDPVASAKADGENACESVSESTRKVQADGMEVDENYDNRASTAAESVAAITEGKCASSPEKDDSAANKMDCEETSCTETNSAGIEEGGSDIAKENCKVVEDQSSESRCDSDKKDEPDSAGKAGEDVAPAVADVSGNEAKISGDQTEETSKDETSMSSEKPICHENTSEKSDSCDKSSADKSGADAETGDAKTDSSEKPKSGSTKGSFKTAAELRRRFWIADGGFTELHHLWALEEQQIEPGKEYETWFRLHDFWLLAGVITHGYRHWQDILTDQRFDLLNQPFKTDVERARKAAFLNRRFQLVEQALVIEEQLRKSYSENPSLIEKPSTDMPSDPDYMDDKFRPLDELAQTLKNIAQNPDPQNPKNIKVQKVLTQVAALVSDINDASYTNMPASLARGYTMPPARPTGQPRAVQPSVRPVSITPAGLMHANAAGQWPLFRPAVPPIAPGVRLPVITQIPNQAIISVNLPPAATSTAAVPAKTDNKSSKEVICID